MDIAPLSVLVLLSLVWFVLYWIVGGVIFAIIGLVRFLRLNKNRFSCLFTFFCVVAAVGAAWMGLLAAEGGRSGACLAKTVSAQSQISDILPNLFTCSAQDLLSAAGLWFLLLMAAGIFLMLISRSPERPLDMHSNT